MKDTRLYYLVELESLGLLDTLEQQELDVWKLGSSENQAAYEETLQVISLSNKALDVVDPQTDLEWAKLSAAIATQAPQEPLVLKPAFWSSAVKWSAAAAIVLLVAFGSYIAFFQKGAGSTSPMHYATALGQKQDIQLADGTQVQLNGGSTLDAEAGYNGTDRRLSLQGEAYFEVAKDKTRPFIVRIGGTEAQALGTAFNLRMAAADQSVQLSVTEGRVKFSAPHQADLELTAGQVAVYDPQQGFVREATPASDAAGWIQDRLIFQDAAFPKAAEQLERSFGVTIHFPESLNAARLTANFERKPLDQVLEVLSAIYGLKAQQADKVVTLSE